MVYALLSAGRTVMSATALISFTLYIFACVAVEIITKAFYGRCCGSLREITKSCLVSLCRMRTSWPIPRQVRLLAGCSLVTRMFEYSEVSAQPTARGPGTQKFRHIVRGANSWLLVISNCCTELPRSIKCPAKDCASLLQQSAQSKPDVDAVCDLGFYCSRVLAFDHEEALLGSASAVSACSLTKHMELQLPDWSWAGLFRVHPDLCVNRADESHYGRHH